MKFQRKCRLQARLKVELRAGQVIASVIGLSAKGAVDFGAGLPETRLFYSLNPLIWAKFMVNPESFFISAFLSFHS